MFLANMFEMDLS